MENKQSLGIPLAKYVDSAKWYSVGEKLYLRNTKVDFNGTTFENFTVPVASLPDTLQEIDNATPGTVGQVLTIKTVSPYDLEWKTPTVFSTLYGGSSITAFWVGGTGSISMTYRYYYAGRINIIEFDRVTFTSGGGVLRIAPLPSAKLPDASSLPIAIRVKNNSVWTDGNVEISNSAGTTHIHFHTDTSSTGTGAGTWTAAAGEIPGLRIAYISST